MTETAAEHLARARTHFQGGEYREALEELERGLIADPALVECYRLGTLVLRMIGNTDLADAFERVVKEPEDAEALYDLGYRFIDHGYFPLAAAFLARSEELAPGSPRTLYEYGWALYKSSRFQAAIPILEQALAGERDFRTLDVLACAHALLGDAPAARRRLEQALEAFDGNDDERGVLDDTREVLDRLEIATSQNSFAADGGIRAWHWVQTGGVLLNIPRHPDLQRDPSGRYRHVILVPLLVAQMILDLEGVAAEAGFRPTIIEYLDPAAELPARLIAERLGATSRPGRTEATEERILFLASDGSQLGPHLEHFSERRPGHVLLSLVFDWSKDHSLCPDVIGLFASSFELPWSSRRGGAVMDPDGFAEEVRQHMAGGSSTGEEREVAAFYGRVATSLTHGAPGRRPSFPTEFPLSHPR